MPAGRSALGRAHRSVLLRFIRVLFPVVPRKKALELHRQLSAKKYLLGNQARTNKKPNIE